jgi:DNA-binding MarR family transcriptional regulator
MNELDKIRREGVRKIFSLVCEQDGLSRSKLSHMSGISLMTVGKIIESLEKRGLVEQKKQISESAGRRASCVYVSRDICFLILDVEESECRAYLCGLDLEMTELVKCRHLRRKNDIPTAFFELVRKNTQITLAEKFCAGIGLILPFSGCDALEFVPGESIANAAKDVFEDNLYAADRLKLSAYAELGSQSSDEVSQQLYLWLGKNAGVVCAKNKKIVSSSDAVACMIYDGAPVYEKLRSKDMKTRLCAAAHIVHSSVMSFSADYVILGGDLVSNGEAGVEKVEKELARMPIPPRYKFPKMKTAEKSALDGMGLVLRERLLKRMKL